MVTITIDFGGTIVHCTLYFAQKRISVKMMC